MIVLDNYSFDISNASVGKLHKVELTLNKSDMSGMCFISGKVNNFIRGSKGQNILEAGSKLITKVFLNGSELGSGDKATALAVFSRIRNAPQADIAAGAGGISLYVKETL